MYRIGEFSFLNNITIKTLRYYDNINLFKPEIVDKYTGYRYYSDKQANELKKIIKYKELGFSLDEIKLLRTNKQDMLINNKINKLTLEIIENEKKIAILKNMINENMKIELKPYQEKYKIGKRYTIKNRNEIKDKLQEVKKELEKLKIPYGYEIFCNFELGYEEENIDCFIGYTLLENKNIENKGDFEIIFNSRSEKKLVAIGTIDSINELYKQIIKYAHDNTIQIRGFYNEVYNNNNVEIYVEAFDLNEENKDYEYYLEHHKISNEIDKTLIGKYKIIEILPDLKYMLNPNKQKSSLDTIYKELILKEDGNTNYNNIKWNKNELIIEIENQKIPLHIIKYTYKNKDYLEILMNESYTYFKNQRPLSYLYEKED